MSETTLPGWEEHTLGDLGQYINGRAFKPAEWGRSGLPIIRIQNLTDPEKEYNYFDGEVRERHLVRDGDLLISWSATLGSFIWDRGDAALNQHIFKVVVNEERIEKQFLHYLVLHILDDLASQTHGSTMKHITKRKFEATPVRIPGLGRAAPDRRPRPGLPPPRQRGPPAPGRERRGGGGRAPLGPAPDVGGTGGRRRPPRPAGGPRPNPDRAHA